MDSAADSLLALSNTVVALAEEEDGDQDDDRSSSLSELADDAADNMESEAADQLSGVEGDSEAETERLEESPDKLPLKKLLGTTPSKLAQATHVAERPEIESLTDSGISSPISSNEELDNLSDAPEDEEEVADDQYLNRSPAKRKREDDEQDEEEQERARRRRTGSIASDEAKSDHESDVEDARSQPSREGTAELEGDIDAPEEDVDDEEEEQEEEAKAESNEESKDKQSVPSGRVSRRRGKDETALDEDQEVEEEPEAADESDEAEVEDAEAAAKSEEEQGKRMAAMEALTALERHFAALRDRLYDERIAAINQELAQLAEPVPSHPELLRQLEAVRKYRDDKFEVEQKLLVYKTGALKNKSVAERSQIHSAYFQTVRDIREKHLERLSEHFYRIQRDRFKSDTAVPSYTIPFPERRSKQITQQMAYNKEVSILSGVAKYVGFPAAPELSQSHQKEMEDDMQKMGLSTTQIRTARPQRVTSAFSSALSAPAAEEQFLEKNPWANAQHPMHRLGISGQTSSRSPLNDVFLTPTNQARNADVAGVGVGSASTIVEHPSAPASSKFNTPHDAMNSHRKAKAANGIQGQHVQSASPLEMRQENASSNEQPEHEHGQGPGPEQNSSPLAARAGAQASPSRPSSMAIDGLAGPRTSSPSLPFKAPGITAGSGHSGGSRFNML